MANELNGKHIAIIATDGVEQIELTQPMTSARDAGATVDLISIKPGSIQGVNGMDKGDTFRVDKTVDQVSVEDYDGLIVPGGVANPDKLRMNADAVMFTRDFFKSRKPVAAICHGPWLLVEAEAVKGRTLTSYPSLRTDIENAGGKWVDEEVHVDNGLVTSRRPEDLKAFSRKMVEEFAEGVHERQSVGSTSGRS